MNITAKIGLSFVAAVALLFAGFGLLATFEPLPPTRQWLFRICYCALAAGAGVALAKIWRKT